MNEGSRRRVKQRPTKYQPACSLHAAGEAMSKLKAIAPHDVNDTNKTLQLSDVHSIGLVEHQELHDVQLDAASLDQVNQAAGRGHEDVGTHVQLALLLLDVRAAVHHDGADAGAVAELLGFVKDLYSQLTRGGQHQGADVRAAAGLGALGHRARAGAEHGGDQGEQKASGLAGAGLRAGHHVSAAQADGDRVLLHRSGLVELGQHQVLQQLRADRVHGELEVGFGAAGADLDRNVVILQKKHTPRRQNRNTNLTK
jgi:hypothetical protein